MIVGKNTSKIYWTIRLDFEYSITVMFFIEYGYNTGVEIKYPVLIYDNLCTSCTVYAKYVNRLVNGQMTMMGHYTPLCEQFKKKIFPDGYYGLEMSWFVTPATAYGGRLGLVRILRHMFSIQNIFRDNGYPENRFDLNECTTDCKTAKEVMVRSYSILTMGKKIQIETM